MSYTLDLFKKDPSTFFEPPKYVVWVRKATYMYNSKKGTYDVIQNPEGLGSLRYFHDLRKAKKRVSLYTTLWGDRHGPFRNDWAVYEWNGKSYDLLFEGLAGQSKKEHEFFKIRLTQKVRRGIKPKPDIEYEVDAALASILKAAG